MIARLKAAYRAWRIRAMEQDLAWQLDRFDSYLHEQAEKLAALRAEQYAGQTSEQVTRNVMQRARGY